MSNQTTDEQTAGQHTKPYRQIIAFTLLGVAVLGFLWHVLGLLLPTPPVPPFTERAAGLLYSEFVGVVTVGFPLVAVLLATHVAPMLRHAKTITLVALVQYGLVTLVALASLVSAVIELFDRIAVRDIVLLLLVVGIRFGMLAVALLVVLRTYLGEYAKQVATPAFGGYPAQPYGGQPYPQPPYQPPAAATPAAAAPAAAAQTAAATAAQYGYAQQQSTQQQSTYSQQSGYTQQYGYAQQHSAQQHSAQQPAAQQHATQQPAAQQHATQQPAVQQHAIQQPAVQQQAAPAGGYYGSQANAPTSAAPASGAPASAPPASSPPATAGTYGQAADQVQQAQQQGQPQQVTGWPPAPSVGATQWPPTPTAKPASSQLSSGEEVQHTQVIKPEQYRGNASG